MTADAPAAADDSPSGDGAVRDPHRSPALERLAAQRGLAGLLGAVALVAAIAIGLGIGAVAFGGDGSPRPRDSSVDAGFARDMSTHHTQAVVMAGLAPGRAADPAVLLYAADIAAGQQFQLGQMQGWLDAWDLRRGSDAAPMSWMSGEAGHEHGEAGGTATGVPSDTAMPGMASPAEMDQLAAAAGRDFDVLFLQLMIRHHEGGVPMAQYAVDHAETGYVRRLAQSIIKAQTAEVEAMTATLAALGGQPLN